MRTYSRYHRCTASASHLEQLSQQPIGRHVERVLAQNASNDRKGVGAQDLHQQVGIKSAGVVDTDNHVVVFRPDVVEAARIPTSTTRLSIDQSWIRGHWPR